MRAPRSRNGLGLIHRRPYWTVPRYPACLAGHVASCSCRGDLYRRIRRNAAAGRARSADWFGCPWRGQHGVSRRDEPLFPSEVCFVHQPVAWVLADSIERAREAAAEVHVEYRPLPAILTIEQAIEKQSFLAGPAHCRRGDAAVAIQDSPHRVSGTVHMGGQEHFYLETQCAIAWRDETGGYALHSSTQHPSETQAVVARVLGLDEHRVTVECLRMGGAFGGKEVQANGWAAIAALGAWKTGRPVRVRLPRHLDMELTGKRHPFSARYRPVAMLSGG